MSENRKMEILDRPLDAIELIDWFWRFLPKEQLDRTPESRRGLCQCGTEKLIARSHRKPNQMRSFLLFSVFIDQMVYTHFPQVYSRFRDRFLFPKLLLHGGGGMAGPSWLVSPHHGYDKLMDWEAARPVAKVLFVECLAYLQNELGVDGATDLFLIAAEREVRGYWETVEGYADQFILDMIKEAIEDANRPVPSKPNNEGEQQDCWEILIALTYIEEPGKRRTDERLMFHVPDDAEDIIDPILKPYGQKASWYFNKLKHGPLPVPLAFLCLQNDHELAWHIREVRKNENEIAFAQYSKFTEPVTEDFVPKVGCIVIYDWEALRKAKEKSLLFDTAWHILKDVDKRKSWLCLLPHLPAEWLALHERTIP